MGQTVVEKISQTHMAEGPSRPLRAATLVFCVWAVLIHLPLAEPLLSPAVPKHHRYRGLVVPAARDRLELTGFQILRHIQVDLRW